MSSKSSGVTFQENPKCERLDEHSLTNVFSFLSLKDKLYLREIFSNHYANYCICNSDPILRVFNIFKYSVIENPNYENMTDIEKKTQSLENVIQYVRKKENFTSFSKIQKVAWNILARKIKTEDQLQHLSEENRNYLTSSVVFYHISQEFSINLQMNDNMNQQLIYYKKIMNHTIKLYGIPDNFRSKEICLAAVTQDRWALRFVPENLINEEICLASVKKNGCALEDVPETLRTEEICIAAVKQNGFALGDVPENLKTEEICLAAVKQHRFALEYVPENLRTEEICLAAVTREGYALRYVPENLRNEEICLTAVTQNGWALEYVPHNLKTEEICLAAVSQSPTYIKYYPGNFLSKTYFFTKVNILNGIKKLYSFFHWLLKSPST